MIIFISFKYVWLNTVTGQFSNSFTEEEINKHCLEEFLKDAKDFNKESILSDKTAFRLIKYECISDENFEFNKFMKLR